MSYDTEPWIRWLYENWLNGTGTLTPEEKGIYADLISLLARFGDRLPNDDAFLARQCNCSTRTFRRIKNRLVDLEKLEIDGDRLTNARAAEEVARADRRRQGASKGGVASGESRRQKQGNGKVSEKNPEKNRETFSESPETPPPETRENNDLTRTEVELPFGRRGEEIETPNPTPSTESHSATPSPTSTLPDRAKARDPTARTDLEADFNRFWATYPTHKRQKGHKGKALEQFGRAVGSGVGAATIIESVARYGAYCVAIDQSSQDAFRWLRGRRWEEDWSVPASAHRPRDGPQTFTQMDQDHNAAGLRESLRMAGELKGDDGPAKTPIHPDAGDQPPVAAGLRPALARGKAGG